MNSVQETKCISRIFLVLQKKRLSRDGLHLFAQVYVSNESKGVCCMLDELDFPSTSALFHQLLLHICAFTTEGLAHLHKCAYFMSLLPMMNHLPSAANIMENCIQRSKFLGLYSFLAFRRQRNLTGFAPMHKFL